MTFYLSSYISLYITLATISCELDSCPPPLFSDSLEEEEEGAALPETVAVKQEELNDSLLYEDGSEAQQNQMQLSLKKEDTLATDMKSLNDSLSHEETGEDVCFGVDNCPAVVGPPSPSEEKPEISSSTSLPLQDVKHSALLSILPQQNSKTSVSSEQSVQVQPGPKTKPVFGKKKKSIANAPQPHVLAPLNDNTLQTVSEPQDLPTVNTTTSDSDKTSDCENTTKECPQPSNEGAATKKPKLSVKPKPSTKEILAKFCADEANKSTKNSEVASDTASCETVQENVKNPRKTLTPEEKEARKIELEQKKLEREKKKEEAEKKRIERENKKKEAEQKREQMKIEREALKKQKQLEAEKKKAEKEQLKIERELKKMEQQQKKAKNVKPKISEGETVVGQSKTSACEDHVHEEMEEMDGNGLKVDDNTGSKANDESEDMEDGLKSEEELIDVDGIDSDDVKSGDNDIELKQEQTADSAEIKSSCSLQDQSVGSRDSLDGNSTSVSSAQALKITNEDDVAPVKRPVKRFKPPTQAGPKPKKTKSTTRGKGGGAARKPSTAPKKPKRRAAFGESDSDSDYSPVVQPLVKRLRPAVLSGPVWVQCENIGCQKWRKLRDCCDPSELPEDWKCSMNADPEHNSCSALEEDWNNLEENQEYVESIFVPGSIVWAKLEGYPW